VSKIRAPGIYPDIDAGFQSGCFFREVEKCSVLWGNFMQVFGSSTKKRIGPEASLKK
jgi:hypothetical protein